MRSKSAMAVAFLVVLLFSTGASAQLYRRWCTSWKSTYTDASTQEDVYQSTAATQRTAQYSFYRLYIVHYYGTPGETEEQIDSGYLTNYDATLGKYCTDYVQISGYTTYRLRQYTKLVRSNRQIYVQSDNHDWGAYYQSLSTTEQLYSLYGWPTYSSANLSPSYQSAQTSVMPVAVRLMNYANTFGYPDDTGKSLHIITKIGDGTNPICDGDPSPSPYWAYNYYDSGSYHYRVCAAGGSSSLPKFKLAHELGHAVADMADGPARNGSWDGDTFAPFSPPDTDTADTDEFCLCDHLTVDAAHCLQSREFIGRAASEGYAHFVSTRLFSDATSAGWFGYYKDTMIPKTTTPFYEVKNQPYWFRADRPDTDTDLDYTTWVENQCDPGGDVPNVGSEWDWMQFFWKMNTASTDAWSMTELGAVWAGTSMTEQCCSNTTTPPLCSVIVTKPQCDLSPTWTWVEFGETWDDLWATAQTQQSGDKRTLFNTTAGASGIRY